MHTLKLITCSCLLLCGLFFTSCTDDLGGGFANEAADFSGPANTGSLPVDPVAGNTVEAIGESPFVLTAEEATSTFSIDADGGSYALTKRIIREGTGIETYASSIRTEEFINYFDYDYPYTSTTHPISLNGEVVSCPWKPSHKLIRIGIQGKTIASESLPGSNFVFLIDVSSSMSGADRLELLKSGFSALVRTLDADDKVSIVTYSGTTRIALSPTSGDQHQTIISALNGLSSGGGTAGGQAILDAYNLAEESLIAGGNNRLILATDGDFNIGITDRDELIQLVEDKRDLGIFLTTVGVGTGNYNEAAMEQIANKGNGTYEYAQNLEEMTKVFVNEKSKFFTVAKDVKIQVEFNPDVVSAYRLIGYENRALANEDFENDEKDAGEIGANQGVTALYEVVPTSVGSLSSASAPTTPYNIDVRYKMPNSDESILLNQTLEDKGTTFDNSSDQMRFVTGAAGFALVLRESTYIEDTDFDDVLGWLNSTTLADPFGYKADLKALVEESKN